MQLLNFSFLSSLKQKLKQRSVIRAIKKMFRKNNDIQQQRNTLLAYYKRTKPNNIQYLGPPKFYATKVKCDDIIITPNDAIKALDYIGYKTPIFLGIVTICTEQHLKLQYRQRAFLKFSIAPDLYAYATLANSTLFITEKSYDTIDISISPTNSTDETKTFHTTILYQRNPLPGFDKASAVRLKFKSSNQNFVIESIDSNFVPFFSWEPNQHYDFKSPKDENKIKKIIKNYYDCYYNKKLDFVQNFPYHYSINA